jgi:hypothetical protein
MAKQPSDASRYQSRYGGGWITAAQWIAELMCERQAKKDGRGLVMKFWLQPQWKKPFAMQLRLANGLMKIYQPAAISRALRSPRGRGAYSLAAGWLDELFAQEQAELDRKQAQAEEARAEPPQPPAEQTDKQPESPRPAFTPGKSKINKLRDI